MQNRIQIDGVWYVREQQEPEVQLDITRFKGMVTESDKYCFEATLIKDDKVPGKYYDGVDIEFTDKRSQPWKTDHWDNSTWLLAVHHNDRDALEEAFELMGNDGVRELKDFIRELIKIGWIKY